MEFGELCKVFWLWNLFLFCYQKKVAIHLLLETCALEIGWSCVRKIQSCEQSFAMLFQRELWLWISGARVHPTWGWSTTTRGLIWQEEAATSQVQDTDQGSVDTEGEWPCAFWMQVASFGWPYHEDRMVQGWPASHSWLVRERERESVCVCVVNKPSMSSTGTAFNLLQYGKPCWSTCGLSWELKSGLIWTDCTRNVI